VAPSVWLVVWLLTPRWSAYQHRHCNLWALLHIPAKGRRQGRAVSFRKNLETSDGSRNIARVLCKPVPEEQQATGRVIGFIFQVHLIRRIERLGRVSEEKRFVPREDPMTGFVTGSPGMFDCREVLIDANSALVEQKHRLQAYFIENLDELPAVYPKLVFRTIKKPRIGQIVVVTVQLDVLQ